MPISQVSLATTASVTPAPTTTDPDPAVIAPAPAAAAVSMPRGCSLLAVGIPMPRLSYPPSLSAALARSVTCFCHYFCCFKLANALACVVASFLSVSDPLYPSLACLPRTPLLCCGSSSRPRRCLGPFDCKDACCPYRRCRSQRPPRRRLHQQRLHQQQLIPIPLRRRLRPRQLR